MNESPNPKKLDPSVVSRTASPCEVGRSSGEDSPPTSRNAPDPHSSRRRVRRAARRATDIRGWLAIARGQDTPDGRPWQAYAFERMVEANPFPSVMGASSPGAVRGRLQSQRGRRFAGINAVEQYVGDWAIDNGLTLLWRRRPRPQEGRGDRRRLYPAAASFLRRMGHG